MAAILVTSSVEVTATAATAGMSWRTLWDALYLSVASSVSAVVSQHAQVSIATMAIMSLFSALMFHVF